MYLPHCKVTNTPFHIKGGDLLSILHLEIDKFGFHANIFVCFYLCLGDRPIHMFIVTLCSHISVSILTARGLTSDIRF